MWIRNWKSWRFWKLPPKVISFLTLNLSLKVLILNRQSRSSNVFNQNRSTEKWNRESTHKTQTLSHCSELNQTPQGTAQKAHYKFNWPICFRHFTNIFVSKCCNNYYWVNCHQELKDDMKKKNAVSFLKCIFWGTAPLLTTKVNPEDSIIDYKDSPLKAFQSKMSISGVDLESSDKYPNSFMGSSGTLAA